MRAWHGTRSMVVALVVMGTCCQAVFAQTWQILPNAPRDRFGDKLEDVVFIDPLVGWACGSSTDSVSGGMIHRTSDGGISWRSYKNTQVSLFRSLGFISRQKGWAGTLNTNWPFWSTTDGGATWQPVTSIAGPRPEGICGIWPVNELVVYGCGKYTGPPIVIKTIDGGTSWTSMDLSPLASWLIDCRFWSADSGIVVGRGPSGGTRVLSTSDGGGTWQVRYSGNRADEWCWKISFPTQLVGYVSIESWGTPDSPCLKTTDGGLHWTETNSTGLNQLQGIGFPTETLGWVGGRRRPQRTNDGGSTWESDNFGASINRFRFLNSRLGYAVGLTVYKYSVPTSVTKKSITHVKSIYR